MMGLENLISLEELQEILEGKRIKVSKLIENNIFTRKTTIEDATVFLLLQEVINHNKRDITVFKENGGWIIHISDILGKNVDEYKINICREKVA